MRREHRLAEIPDEIKPYTQNIDDVTDDVWIIIESQPHSEPYIVYYWMKSINLGNKDGFLMRVLHDLNDAKYVGPEFNRSIQEAIENENRNNS